MAIIRVLLADESARIIENLRKRLGQEEDLTVCAVAGDGDTALQEALRTQPNVAVVDAGLPGMDGIQTTEMLVQYLPNTGVILLSMEAENEAFRRAMLAGAREFLQKPFSGDELVSAIRRVHDHQPLDRNPEVRPHRRSAPREGWGSRRSRPTSPCRSAGPAGWRCWTAHCSLATSASS